MTTAFEGIAENVRTIDYVCGWFAKATSYIGLKNERAAFVATNSVNQGRQVEVLWGPLFRGGVKIFFAHESFAWSNLATKNAGVTVSVIGITKSGQGPYRLFSSTDGHPVSRAVSNINGYLIPGPNVEVSATRKGVFGLPEMLFGNMPNDGGELLLTPEAAHEAKDRYGIPSRFIRPFWGSQEFINGVEKYCIWVLSEEAAEAGKHPWLKERFDRVREGRMASSRAATRELSKAPYAFGEVRQRGNENIILLPRITSEKREYLPVGLVPAGGIISSQNFGIYGAHLYIISLISSRVHRSWVDALCGNLELRIMYSNTICWNTFPVPKLTESDRANLTRCAEDILLAREARFPATIAELYDPRTMPDDLRAAHDRNDETLERIYIGRRFRNDTERLEKLFDMYTKMTAKKEKAS